MIPPPNAESPPPRPEKPTWMQILEAESWQAELLISGIAIYGTLQLPALQSQLMDWLFFAVPDAIADPMFLINWYLLIAIVALIVSFLVHFTLRALWVALIGLVSVFPEGIRRVENRLVSLHFIDQLRADLGDVNDYNSSLDRLCSSLLAFAFTLAFSLTGISLLLLAIILLSWGLHILLPAYPVGSFFQLFVIGIGIIFILSSLFSSRWLRDREWARRLHFPVFKTMALLLFNITYRPVYFIQYIFYTNINLRQYSLTIFAALFVLMGVAIPLLINSSAIYLRQENFVRIGRRTDRLLPDNYFDRLPEGALVIQSMLPSAVVNDTSALELFVPFPRRQEDQLTELCPEPAFAADISSDSLRVRQREHFLYCIRRNLVLELNGNRVTNFTVRRYEHPNRGENGLLFFLLDPALRRGENQLRIQHPYRNDERGDKYEIIQFLYIPRASVGYETVPPTEK